MSSEPPLPADRDASGGHVVEVDEAGDIVLDVTFETSPAVLNKSRKALPPADRTLNSRPKAPKPTIKVAYRVSISALKGTSRYFAHLFSNPQFSEARLVAETHNGLVARGVKPSAAGARDLPFIALVDDDEATQAAGREIVFEDMLRILHRRPIKTAKVVMSYAVTLAIVADRFDCVDTVARILNGHHKFKWPQTSNKLCGKRCSSPQKVLVSGLLGQPLRLRQATRELIVRGSSLWSAYNEAEADAERTAAWWSLPQGLERELKHRRECVLNTVASVQRHFLSLYASRDRQCKLGYDSSAACDSFHLGQMLRFLTSKELLYLVDFSPASLDLVPDTSQLDLEELMATLKQFPNYQVDRHHTNCGPQIRIKPIMDYLRTMLSANVISISYADWTRRRVEVAWAERRDGNGAGNHGGHTFDFTRAIANDQRLQHEGMFHTDRMAKSLFTAESWDWTPEG
ncbi:protein related to hydroxyproline-rich glycoprotein [Ophiocordyceps sinensis CO18]|uniref:Protein related to hydroxyproline-rich glycoprotein n=1 Tax=Ophiocordyceps sinensis (strain Co18 / CGMCC 3.14243) TaxID=911162 RepID=T5AG65_OPHSC|nr:protein related to hydroxyproline-rich glycoprotein [Ophiocordyceps sinensis CO18]